jgi:hypothetical protein
VSSWSDEVQACMYPEINLIHTARLLLLQHIRLMLVVQEFDNWHPRIAVVDIVSEARRVNYGQTDYVIIRERQMQIYIPGMTYP